MPMQSQRYQGRWCWGVERACSSHGLSVPEALLQPDCHLGLSAAPGASPARSFLRPGACKAAAGEKLACRCVTSLLLLALVLGLERDSWAPGDTDGRGWGAATHCKECECTEKAGRRGYVPSLVNSACYMQGNGCDSGRHLYNPWVLQPMGFIQAKILPIFSIWTNTQKLPT